MSSGRLPSLPEARQLCRLRGLRVQRARERIAAAQLDVERALEVVRQRQRAIERLRADLVALRQAIVTTLAPALPRWSQITSARQEALADQLEREEYGLIDDEHALEQVEEKLQQARADLTRALAREDAVRGLADQARRAGLRERERRNELELDDQQRPRAA